MTASSREIDRGIRFRRWWTLAYWSGSDPLGELRDHVSLGDHAEHVVSVGPDRRGDSVFPQVVGDVAQRRVRHHDHGRMGRVACVVSDGEIDHLMLLSVATGSTSTGTGLVWMMRAVSLPRSARAGPVLAWVAAATRVAG